MFSPIWGKGNGRGISGFAVNRGAVNRGFTVLNFPHTPSHCIHINDHIRLVSNVSEI